MTKHSSKNLEILHNKVDCNKFFNSKPIAKLSQPLILSVGNLIEVKNQVPDQIRKLLERESG